MSDVARLLREIADLRRRMAMVVRSGTVHESKPGRVRLNWGIQNINGADEPYLSPWIRISGHHGAITEHTPMPKGQTVVSISMDPNHLSAVVIPHSDSDLNPMDPDASMDKRTMRIRKPPEDEGDTSGPDPTYPKREDADDDYRAAHSYDGHETHVGGDIHLQVVRGKILLKHGDRELQFDPSGKMAFMKVGGVQVHLDVESMLARLTSGEQEATLGPEGLTHKDGEDELFKSHKDRTGVDLPKGQTYRIGGRAVVSLINGIMKFGAAMMHDSGKLEFRNAADTKTNFAIDDNGALTIDVDALKDATNDTLAAGQGVPVGGVYRNGSALMVRVT
jgi:hypothetical protein